MSYIPGANFLIGATSVSACGLALYSKRKIENAFANHSETSRFSKIEESKPPGQRASWASSKVFSEINSQDIDNKNLEVFEAGVLSLAVAGYAVSYSRVLGVLSHVVVITALSGMLAHAHKLQNQVDDPNLDEFLDLHSKILRISTILLPVAAVATDFFSILGGAFSAGCAMGYLLDQGYGQLDNSRDYRDIKIGIYKLRADIEALKLEDHQLSKADYRRRVNNLEAIERNLDAKLREIELATLCSGTREELSSSVNDLSKQFVNFCSQLPHAETIPLQELEETLSSYFPLPPTGLTSSQRDEIHRRLSSLNELLNILSRDDASPFSTSGGVTSERLETIAQGIAGALPCLIEALPDPTGIEIGKPNYMENFQHYTRLGTLLRDIEAHTRKFRELPGVERTLQVENFGELKAAFNSKREQIPLYELGLSKEIRQHINDLADGNVEQNAGHIKEVSRLMQEAVHTLLQMKDDRPSFVNLYGAATPERVSTFKASLEENLRILLERRALIEPLLQAGEISSRELVPFIEFLEDAEEAAPVELITSLKELAGTEPAMVKLREVGDVLELCKWCNSNAQTLFSHGDYMAVVRRTKELLEGEPARSSSLNPKGKLPLRIDHKLNFALQDFFPKSPSSPGGSREMYSREDYKGILKGDLERLEEACDHKDIEGAYLAGRNTLQVKLYKACILPQEEISPAFLCEIAAELDTAVIQMGEKEIEGFINGLTGKLIGVYERFELELEPLFKPLKRPEVSQEWRKHKLRESQASPQILIPSLGGRQQQAIKIKSREDRYAEKQEAYLMRKEEVKALCEEGERVLRKLTELVNPSRAEGGDQQDFFQYVSSKLNAIPEELDVKNEEAAYDLFNEKLSDLHLENDLLFLADSYLLFLKTRERYPENSSLLEIEEIYQRRFDEIIRAVFDAWGLEGSEITPSKTTCGAIEKLLSTTHFEPEYAEQLEVFKAFLT